MRTMPTKKLKDLENAKCFIQKAEPKNIPHNDSRLMTPSAKLCLKTQSPQPWKHRCLQTLSEIYHKNAISVRPYFWHQLRHHPRNSIQVRNMTKFKPIFKILKRNHSRNSFFHCFRGSSYMNISFRQECKTINDVECRIVNLDSGSRKICQVCLSSVVYFLLFVSSTFCTYHWRCMISILFRTFPQRSVFQCL